MKAIEKLKQMTPRPKEPITKINIEIKEIENELKRLNFQTFSHPYKAYCIVWDHLSENLIIYSQMGSPKCPLIDTTEENKRFLYPYLPHFIEQIIEEETLNTGLKE